MSRNRVIALGRQYSIKYAESATSYTEDQTWQRAFDEGQKALKILNRLESILHSDTNVDFSDLFANLKDINQQIHSIMGEITFRIGNLYGSVDKDVWPVDLNKEYQKHRK